MFLSRNLQKKNKSCATVAGAASASNSKKRPFSSVTKSPLVNFQQDKPLPLPPPLRQDSIHDLADYDEIFPEGDGDVFDLLMEEPPCKRLKLSDNILCQIESGGDGDVTTSASVSTTDTGTKNLITTNDIEGNNISLLDLFVEEMLSECSSSSSSESFNSVGSDESDDNNKDDSDEEMSVDSVNMIDEIHQPNQQQQQQQQCIQEEYILPYSPLSSSSPSASRPSPHFTSPASSNNSNSNDNNATNTTNTTAAAATIYDLMAHEDLVIREFTEFKLSRVDNIRSNIPIYAMSVLYNETSDIEGIEDLTTSPVTQINEARLFGGVTKPSLKFILTYKSVIEIDCLLESPLCHQQCINDKMVDGSCDDDDNNIVDDSNDGVQSCCSIGLTEHHHQQTNIFDHINLQGYACMWWLDLSNYSPFMALFHKVRNIFRDQQHKKQNQQSLSTTTTTTKEDECESTKPCSSEIASRFVMNRLNLYAARILISCICSEYMGCNSSTPTSPTTTTTTPVKIGDFIIGPDNQNNAINEEDDANVDVIFVGGDLVDVTFRLVNNQPGSKKCYTAMDTSHSICSYSYRDNPNVSLFRDDDRTLDIHRESMKELLNFLVESFKTETCENVVSIRTFSSVEMFDFSNENTGSNTYYNDGGIFSNTSTQQELFMKQQQQQHSKSENKRSFVCITLDILSDKCRISSVRFSCVVKGRDLDL